MDWEYTIFALVSLVFHCAVCAYKGDDTMQSYSLVISLYIQNET